MVSFTVYKGSKSGAITKGTTTRDVGRDEVLIKVTHSGVCGTDEHCRHRDIGLGHEGVGIVEETGKEVTNLSVGDCVGWGYVHNSCGKCKECLTGRENVCAANMTYSNADLDQGSFASHGIWKASYVFKIPDAILPEDAAPLMCGGATVFHLLQSFGIRSTERVGIIGIGGLGHLAIQFAAKMGCEVVAISSSDRKKDEATKLGAREFVVTGGKGPLEISKPLDHLIVTTSAQPDWSRFLAIMAVGGSIFPITVSSDDFKMPYSPIIRKELRIQGSRVAPRQRHREMIEFAAFHGIKPIIEKFPLTAEGITEAMEKLNSGKMRYRAVLVAQ